MKAREVRAMAHADRISSLEEMRQELMHQRGVSAMGGAPPNPGRMRALRRSIARLETILHEDARAAAAAPAAPKGKVARTGKAPKVVKGAKAPFKPAAHGQSRRKSERTQ